MDVRGPKRAAARRLIQGTVVACAAAAAMAPAAMAGTVSNVHPAPPPPDPTAPPPDPVSSPATYTAAAGESNSLTLSRDAAGGVTFADSVGVSGQGGVLADGDEDTCGLTDPNTTDPNPSWTCPLATRVSVDLGDGNDTLAIPDGLPPLTINGGDGIDRLDFTPSNSVSVNLGAPSSALAAANIENVTGSPGSDAITGDDLPNSEVGGAGNDTLKGMGGDDTLEGGAGVNTLRGGDGDDALTAGDEGDTLVGGLGIDTFNGGAGADEIVALDGVADNITCGAGDNVTADLGANNVSDTITNPDACASIRGSVPATPPAQPAGTITTETTTPVIVVPAIGSPALVPVLAPGKANIADLTPPSASMRSFTRQRLKTVAVKGVPVRVSCQEACGISVALSVDRKTARRLKLDARSTPVVVATATAKRAAAGTTVLRAKFTKKARPALQRSKRAVTMTTQVLVSDASGNGTLLSRRVTLVK
jgi:hypothetical protein